ncbi:MAG: hemolysin family protein [Candidatus Gracilibacteria bacterium]|jgi:putative hemolysin
MNSDLLILAVLILFSAFFSASETSLISLNQSKVDELIENKRKNSRILKKVKANPHKLLITVLIGNNIVNTAASAYATYIFTNMFGSAGIGIATGVMTFVILVFAEITPKSFAHSHAETIALLVARPVYVLQYLLYPIVFFFEVIVRVVNFMFGEKHDHSVTEGELVAMLKIGAQEGSFEKQEKEFIENVLEFNDIQVEDVMTPRVAIEALDSEMTIQEAVDFVIKHSHTRIPVYKDNLDNIIGVIATKDMLKFFDAHSSTKKLKNLKLAVPLEVPLSKKIDKLFREFQRKHMHMAIVIDEFGGTAGLVTLEDLLEEIVGDIADEFDVSEKPIEIVDEYTLITKGDALIEDINDFFKINIGEGNKEKETVNSFLSDYLQRFPREGEIVKLLSVKILILRMKKNVIERIKITKFKQRAGKK